MLYSNAVKIESKKGEELFAEVSRGSLDKVPSLIGSMIFLAALTGPALVETLEKGAVIISRRMSTTNK